MSGPFGPFGVPGFKRALNAIRNLADVANPAAAFANIKQAATDAVSGVLAIATQAAMEAASSVVLAVTPGRQHNHPGHPKFWALVTVSGGTPTLVASYNVTSITDTAQGRLTLTIATDFANANWSCQVTLDDTGVGSAFVGAVSNGGRAAGTVEVRSWNTGASSDAALTDPAAYHIVGFGDQA